jgi:hypothetical protein
MDDGRLATGLSDRADGGSLPPASRPIHSLWVGAKTMSEATGTLDRAIRVHETFDRFLDVCLDWLEIEGDLFWQLHPSWTNHVQRFGGVPEVYRFAFRLLEAIGPGLRHEVGWATTIRTPELLRSVSNVARLARQVIVEDWGWEPGWTDARLRELVEERRATGMPITRARLDEMEARANVAIIADFPPEDRWKCYAEMPPFREVIPEEKREQFERIVQLRLAIVSGLPIRSRARLDGVFRLLAHARLDDLDAHEREVHMLVDRPYSEERHEYQNKPLIGERAATLISAQVVELREAEWSLQCAIQAERRAKRECDPSLSEEPRDRVHHKPLTACETWCIEAISKNGRRMSKAELQGLATREGSHGKSTVGNCLPKLCDRHLIENKRKGGPYGDGYGLIEWD